MAQIVVTAAEVRAKAQELRNMNGQFKTKVEQLVADENNLGSKWEGQAKNAFHNAFTQDKQQMDAFYELIEKYAVAMDEIADEYERQEQANESIASSRSY